MRAPDDDVRSGPVCRFPWTAFALRVAWLIGVLTVDHAGDLIHQPDDFRIWLISSAA
jgi:hypothetical protein